MTDVLPTVPGPERPAEALAAVVALRRLADRLEAAAVDRAIADGWTWAQIAEALDITRQGAHKRHAARLRAAGRPAGEG
jgi:hypothetical protein